MISHLSTCPRRWNSDAVCTCQPSEERVRAEYRGAQLIDCGSVLRVRFTENRIPKGLRAKLRGHGFASGPNGSLQRASNVNAIFRTQSILQEFCGEPQ
jgi:hypothetical protein